MQKVKRLAALIYAAVKEKLTTEPVVVRTLIAGVLGYLVAAGIIDTALADSAETVLVALAGVLLVGSARSKVTPTQTIDAVVADTERIADPAE